jgi:TRAP-type mannitol/chloroaromatic compound transport system substrate-binding protein
MDRREFLRTTGAAAAAASAATVVAGPAALAEPTKAAPAKPAPVESAPVKTAPPAPAIRKGTQELRLAMPWPDGTSGLADQARRLGQRILAMSEGRYRIDFVPAAGNGLAAVRAGEADLYHATEHDHLDAHRGLAYFAGLPGDCGIAPQHLQAWILVGGGQELWDDVAGDFGVKALLAGHAGAQLFRRHRRIETMSALAGEKCPCAGSRAMWRAAWASSPSPSAAPISRLPWRGATSSPPSGGRGDASHSVGLQAVARFSTGTSINRHGTALSLGMRRAFWDGLGASGQAMFAAAAAAELQLALAEEEAHRHLLWPQPSARQTWPLAGELAHAIGRVADAVVAHAAGSDARARRINASYETFRRVAIGDGASTRGGEAA